jgi:uncharacterized protein involved in exopolysaccharide biosynthesis
MSLVHLIKLLLRNWKSLFFVPVLMAGSIYYLTRNEKKEFSTETVIFTGIASGYSLNGAKVADFFATSNAFDNLLTLINSRETKVQLGITLLAQHLLLNKHDPAELSWGAYDELHKLISDSLRNKLVKVDLPMTVASINEYYGRDEQNVIFQIINSDQEFYSVKALNSIEVQRINLSDLIKLSYKCSDAAICQHTLDMMTKIFVNKHRELKESQTTSVIAYFEEQVKLAYQKLDRAELNFLDFNTSNDIINFYEQTKAVAIEREDLYTQNHLLEMDERAQESSLEKINDNIKGRIYQTLYGDEVMKQREKLSAVYNKIAFAELLGKDAQVNQKKTIDSLKLVAIAVESEIKETLDRLYVKTNTPNGIPTKNILDEWVKTTIAYEQSKARLTVMDKRKKEFQEEYRKFAPLGAMLKKIERQISVTEQEYLELLHGLNLARLMQQNNQLTSKLNIVDPPFLPTKANASKRKILAVVGFIAGFMIVMSIILIHFLINQTLQQPARAVKITGVKLLGVYPLLHERQEFVDKANLRLTQQLLVKLDLTTKPALVGVYSMQADEGKTTLIDMWKKHFTELGYLVQVHDWNLHNPWTGIPLADIVLVEIPAMEKLLFTPETIPSFQFTILVCRANRVWTTLDKEFLVMFNKVTKLTPALLLNGVEADFAEEYIGEVPKKRNFIRATVKRVLKFQFGNRKMISRIRIRRKKQ